MTFSRREVEKKTTLELWKTHTECLNCTTQNEKSRCRVELEMDSNAIANKAAEGKKENENWLITPMF